MLLHQVSHLRYHLMKKLGALSTVLVLPKTHDHCTPCHPILFKHRIKSIVCFLHVATLGIHVDQTISNTKTWLESSCCNPCVNQSSWLLWGLVGTSVVQLFDFRNNWWIWFFKIFRIEEPLILVFWGKKIQIWELLVPVNSWTSKNQQFSWKNRQRTTS